MFIYINAGEDKWIEVNSRRDLARFASFNHFRQTMLKSVTNWGLITKISDFFVTNFLQKNTIELVKFDPLTSFEPFWF